MIYSTVEPPLIGVELIAVILYSIELKSNRQLSSSMHFRENFGFSEYHLCV